MKRFLPTNYRKRSVNLRNMSKVLISPPCKVEILCILFGLIAYFFCRTLDLPGSMILAQSLVLVVRLSTNLIMILEPSIS